MISFFGAGSRRSPGLLDEALKPGGDSLPGEAAEGSNLAEVLPTVHKRSVRSRERVHTWPMSVWAGNSWQRR